VSCGNFLAWWGAGLFNENSVVLRFGWRRFLLLLFILLLP
jgi:hypothetical protein